MQTHVQTPSDHSTQHQQHPAQLLAEPQTTFEDSRPQTVQLKTLQATMGNSPQQQSLQALQAKMNTRAHAKKVHTLQAHMAVDTVAQRVEEDEPLQAKVEDETVQREAAAEAPQPNNTGLPDNLKSGIESLSGMNMDHVKVHYNSDKPAQLNAHAYAQGSEIHVAAGQEQHLPHEAWHVVQQAQGRVKPTMQTKTGVPVNDKAELEGEADVMGAKAVEQNATQLATEGRPKIVDTALQSNSAPHLVQRVAHANNFEQSLLFELNNAHVAAPIAGLAAIPPLGVAIPHALTGGGALDALFNTAMAAARRMDDGATPRGGANALNPNPLAVPVVVPGVGGAVQELMEMTDIRNFLVAISPGAAVGIGAGQTPALQDRSVVNWGSMHQEFGTYVQAQLRRGGGQLGSQPSTTGGAIGGGNWADLHHRKNTPGGATLYARGHLLHERMGGPGLDYNLTPLTNGNAFGANSSNLTMATYVEHTVESAFNNMWGVYGPPSVTAVDYQVVVSYTGHNRPGTTRIDAVRSGYTEVNIALQNLPAPLGVSPGIPTHAQIMAAEAIPVGLFVPPIIYPGAFPGGVFPANSIFQGHVIALPGTGATLGLAVANTAIVAAVNHFDGTAVAHINSAMASITAHGMGTDADTFESTLSDNAELWALEDNIVPTQVTMSYNWTENGTPTGWRTRPVDVDLPNSLASPYS